LALYGGAKYARRGIRVNLYCPRAGVNEALIAKKLKEQLEAKQTRWNPEKKAFELFADHDARLVALREVIRLFGGYGMTALAFRIHATIMRT
jgi:hypothetical protein